MPFPPFITAQDRVYLDACEEEGFRRLARGLPHDVTWKKYNGNSVTVPGFGDAEPQFLSACPIDAIVETIDAKQLKSQPGDKDLDGLRIHILTKEWIAAGMSNRDRFIVDGIEYQVAGNIVHEDMGHETWTVSVSLSDQTQTPPP